jgi:hypothetical protein
MILRSSARSRVVSSMTRMWLLAVLLPGCVLDFSHGASSDPGTPPSVCGDGERGAHEVCASIVTVPITGGATGTRLYDLNGDGKLDLLYGTTGTFAYRLGDGHGNFGDPITGPPIGDGSSVVQVAARPFQAGGPLGFATATGSGEVAAWERLPDGTLDLIGSYMTSTPIIGIDIANVGGGGEHAFGESVVIAGAGGYEIAEVAPQTLARTYLDSAVAPVMNLSIVRATPMSSPNNDGLDVAVIVGLFEQSSSWTFVMNGDQTGPHGGWELGLQPYASHFGAATVADFAGDGYAQLLAGVELPPGIVTTGDGGPYMTPTNALPAIDFLDTADLDGDNRPDIIAGSLEPQRLTIAFADIKGELTIGNTYELAGQIAALHIDGDVNGDGIADPVVTYASGDVAILMSEAP